MFININDIKNGMTIIIDGKLCLIEEFQHHNPGKGSAVMRMKLRNLRTGALVDESYSTNIKIEKAMVEKVKLKYLYPQGDSYVFMNSETWEQPEIPADKLKDQVKFLKEDLEIDVSYYEGEILGITLPEKVEYEVTETTDAVKGNTTNNATKDATIETGYTLRVPMFISQGEHIIVSTLDGKYVSKA